MTRGTTYLDDLRNDKTYSPPENPERHDRVITLKILNPPNTSSAHPAEVEIRVKQNTNPTPSVLPFLENHKRKTWDLIFLPLGVHLHNNKHRKQKAENKKIKSLFSWFIPPPKDTIPHYYNNNLFSMYNIDRSAANAELHIFPW